jgi:hypothetical protein
MDEPGKDTGRRKLRAVLIGLALVALLLVLLFACGTRDKAALDGAGDGDAELGDVSFTIDGDSTEAMSPGLTVGIDVHLTNAHRQEMLVSHLAVAMESVSAPEADPLHPCSVADFTIVQPAADLLATVPAHTTSSFSALGVAEDRWPRVGMLDRSVNQDGCQGALVTLAYSGSGTLQD